MNAKVYTAEQYEQIAESAYRAYGKTTDFKNYQGLPMPEWGALPDGIRKAWLAAIKQVQHCLDCGIECADSTLEEK